MRVLKRILLILLICWVGVFVWFVVLPYLGWGLEPAAEEVPETEVATVVTVQRGDLTIDITAIGNLELSLKEDLAFQMTGYVEEVLVEEGEFVEEGQLLAKLDTSEWAGQVKTLEDVESLEMEVRQAEVERARQQYWEAVIKYDYGKISEEDLFEALDDLRNAEKELGKLAQALEAGAEVKAPFAGFITKVNVNGGNKVYKGTTAVQLADPNKFEADILVGETDIFQVKLGGDATVQVATMPTINLPAKVTHISPTATIKSGVVYYEVKVEVKSLELVQQELPTMTPQDLRLREGLTVTVSILVEERKDVLLVPNRAIIHRGRKTLVQVLKDGVVEERAIKTGISDWQYTEVTNGLSEGEKVVIPETTTTTLTTPTPRSPML